MEVTFPRLLKSKKMETEIWEILIQLSANVKYEPKIIKGTTVRTTTVARFFAKPVLPAVGISTTKFNTKQ